jgi:Membrane proteins related to metalloendopeptidases
MMENDTQNSRQATSTALHNAPQLAKIAQAGMQGGPAGAATEAAVQYRKEVLVVVIAVFLLPVLVLLMLPGAIFGTLTQPSTAINNDLEVAANVIQLRNTISDILQEAYEDTLAKIESERTGYTYTDIVDSVGGHVSYNAFQLISMYCAYQGENDYTKISLSDLSEQVKAHQSEYYTYSTSDEVHTESIEKEVHGQTVTVHENHVYTIFTLSYVGDDYFADTVWQLDDKQKNYADAYAHNLTIYLNGIEEREGITILGQINGSLVDDGSPAPSNGFGNPFNDPNWKQHITSGFGKREDVGISGKDTTSHNGLDIAYPYGTPILAVEAGTVITAGYHVSYGNYLVINHGGGYCTLYAHCSQLLVQAGNIVNKYDTIAKVGSTGDSTGNHLHICVIVDGVYVNPKGYLN